MHCVVENRARVKIATIQDRNITRQKEESDIPRHKKYKYKYMVVPFMFLDIVSLVLWVINRAKGLAAVKTPENQQPRRDP